MKVFKVSFFPVFHVNTRCVYVRDDVHSRLMRLKYAYGFRSVNDLLEVILDYIENKPFILREVIGR